MSFSIDHVRRTWERQEEAKRRARYQAKKVEQGQPTWPDDVSMAAPSMDEEYRYVVEAYSDFLIVGNDGTANGVKYRVPFVVQADNTVAFGAEIPVKIQYVELSDLTRSEQLELAIGEEPPGNTLVSLSIMSKVSAYTRRSKSGKAVRVESYFRTLEAKDLVPNQTVIDRHGKQKTVKSVSGGVVNFKDGTKGVGSFRVMGELTEAERANPKAPKQPHDDRKAPSGDGAMDEYKDQAARSAARRAEELRAMSDSALSTERLSAVTHLMKTRAGTPEHPAARALVDAIKAEQQRRVSDPYEGLDQDHGDLYEHNSVEALEAAAEKARQKANGIAYRESGGREAHQDVSILESAVEDAKARDRDEARKNGTAPKQSGNVSEMTDAQLRESLVAMEDPASSGIKSAQDRARDIENEMIKRSKAKRLDPKGDLVAQYKSGQGLINSKGDDDFGRENVLLMDNDQLAEVAAWRKAQNAKGDTGQSGASDLAVIEAEIKRRGRPSPTDDARDQPAQSARAIQEVDRSTLPGWLKDGGVIAHPRSAVWHMQDGEGQQWVVDWNDADDEEHPSITPLERSASARVETGGVPPGSDGAARRESLNASRSRPAAARIAEARRTRDSNRYSPDEDDRDWDGFSLATPAPTLAEMKDLSSVDLDWLANNARGITAGQAAKENARRRALNNVPRKLDPKGDLVAQYKSGQGMWSSRGVDDFGRETLSLMDNDQLAEVKAWRESQNNSGNFGQSGGADTGMIDSEIRRRTRPSPTDDERDQPRREAALNAARALATKMDVEILGAKAQKIFDEPRAGAAWARGMSDEDLDNELQERERDIGLYPGAEAVRNEVRDEIEARRGVKRKPVRWTPPPRTPVPLKPFGFIKHEDDTPIGTIAYPSNGGTSSPYRYRKTADGDWEPLKREGKYLGPGKGYIEEWVPSGGKHADTLATTSGGGDANWRAEVVGGERVAQFKKGEIGTEAFAEMTDDELGAIDGFLEVMGGVTSETAKVREAIRDLRREWEARERRRRDADPLVNRTELSAGDEANRYIELSGD